VLLLPLLLQPAAAKAITARPAIAVVRFIFFIFLSLIGSSGCREAHSGPFSGCIPLRQRIDGRFCQVLCAAAESDWASTAVGVLGRANITASTVADDLQPSRNKRRFATQTQSCRSQLARF